MIDPNLAYAEFVELIAAGTTPEKLIDFQPSQKAKERVAELIRRQKTDKLTSDEDDELRQYMYVEHIVRLAKARARQHVGQS